MRKPSPFALCLLLVVSLMWLGGASRALAHPPAVAMAEAAQRFLASLDAGQKELAQKEFTDAERENWNFVPMERTGLSLKQMKPHQQQLALALLSSAISHRGLGKMANIMALEQVLHEFENQNPKRDPAAYHIWIFGVPSSDKTWGWRFEGHHLSVSLTLVDGQKIATTPTMMGANPAEVRQGPQSGLRVLHAEEDLARSFVKMLDEKQQAAAILNIEVPKDFINLPGRAATKLTPEGIAASELSEEQRRALLRLIREYVSNYRNEMAREDMRKIREAGFETIHFAWIGSTEKGQPHYYRIQGPTFIMEYDNTQNDANHVHVVWRDAANDFGADMLKHHYDHDHAHP